MKRRGRRGGKNETQDFTSREGVLAFVDQLMPDVKPAKGNRELARSKSNGATGGAIKSLDDRIRRIAAQSVIPESKIRTIDENAQTVKKLGSSISALEERVDRVTEQSNKTLGMLGDLLQKFNDYKKEVDVKFKKLEKDLASVSNGGGLGSMRDLAGDLAGGASKDAKTAKVAKGGAAESTVKAPTATAPAAAKSGLMKSIGSMAAKGGARIPLVGGLIEGVSEFVEGGDLGRSIAAGAGSVLGGLIGGALGTVVAPGVGTALGGIGGSMAGAELAKSGFDLIFGNKGPKESEAVKAARTSQSAAAGAAAAAPGALPPSAISPSVNVGGTASIGGGNIPPLPAGSKDSEGNKKIFINAMNEAGVKSNEERAAMAAVIMGESRFMLNSEMSYSGTPNGRIRTIFGSTVQGLTDAQLDELKKNDEAFFNRVYGGRLGNSPNEGFKYRGRGFIQLTGKGNYEKYSRVTGVDLVSNPDLANDPAVAAKVAAVYMMKTRGGGGSVYEQIARGVGNPVAETEAVKKQAYAQFVSSGEFSSDKAGQAPQKEAIGDTATAGGGQTAVQQDSGGSAPPAPAAAGVSTVGSSTDASPTQKESASAIQQGKGRDFTDSARKLTFAPGVDPNINEGIMQKIAGLESSFGKLTVTSGYRDPQRNASAGGAKNSAHMRKNAVDVTFSGDERKTLELVQMASKAGIGGIGVYAPGRVHLDTESRRVWGPSFGPESIPGWAKAALQAHMSGQWGQYDAAAAGRVPPGGRETLGGGSGRIEGGTTAFSQGGSRAQAVPVTSPQMTSRAQMPSGGDISGTVARAPGMGPLAGILGGMHLGKMPQMPSFGGGLLGGALGGIGNAILGQATSMIGGQISGAIMGPGGIGGTTIGGKLLGGLLGPGTGAMIGPIMSAVGRGDSRTLAGPQPMNALMGMLGNMIGGMNKSNQSQSRGVNTQFMPDSYRDNKVPAAMPPSSMMRELFGYDISGGYYPQR